MYVYIHMHVTTILHRDHEFERGEEWVGKRRETKQRRAIGGVSCLTRLAEAVSSGFSSQDASWRVQCSPDKGKWELTMQRSRRPVQVRKCFSVSASLHFSAELWVHLLGFHSTVNKPLSVLCAGLLSTQNSVLLLFFLSSIKHLSSRQMH